MKFLLLPLAFLIFNANASDKFPIYAKEDGEVLWEAWEDSNSENTEVMNFQKNYKECMEDELAVFKSENYCIAVISLHFNPKSDRCIEYYYDVMEVAKEGGVQKGDLIGYTNARERLKPSIQNTNARGCQ